MRRFYSAVSGLLGCMAIALLVLGSIAVPTQVAFADSCDCSYCASYPPENQQICYFNCQQQCQRGGATCPSECLCSVLPCADDVCSSGTADCTACKCQDKAGTSACECVKK